MERQPHCFLDMNAYHSGFTRFTVEFRSSVFRTLVREGIAKVVMVSVDFFIELSLRRNVMFTYFPLHSLVPTEKRVRSFLFISALNVSSYIKSSEHQVEQKPIRWTANCKLIFFDLRQFPSISVISRCHSQTFKYSCPRCNIKYCCLYCYRSEGHQQCSEAFYKVCCLLSIDFPIPNLPIP